MSARESRPKLVRSLQAMWENHYQQNTYLKAVSIGDGSALRGIKNSRLEFQFPVTVLCGPNSTGKTTFLALSVLAFHDDSSLKISSTKKKCYDFGYFFGFSDKDKHKSGIKITWEYADGKRDEFAKGEQRWMRYMKKNGVPRRPIRGCKFVGLSRIVPTFEKKGYSKEFRSLKKHKTNIENQDLSIYMGEIMGKPYTSLTPYENPNSASSHRLNEYNSTHTSFNAGAGEECLTYILDTLLSAKDGSIIAIEEIEIGLHPATMEKLVDAILDIARKKKLQILITTHSPDFLRCCPKESVMLAERSENNEVYFTHMPNIENAVYSVGGKANASLFIVCEDEMSANFINLCINKKQRDIVRINSYGGQDELLTKAEVIAKSNGKNVLIIWDGDAKDDLLKQKEPKEPNVYTAKLPGGFSPEKFIISQIKNDNIKQKILDEYDINESDWAKLKNNIQVLSDDHDLVYTLTKHLIASEDKDTLLMKNICKIVYQNQKGIFSDLLRKIEDILNPKKAAA
ncbi:MAG: ATP-binding protein [Alphaproteobacteria bacterium]|nr:ATP-binding protein [Alphaproteobacteria bacterium]